MRDGLLTEADLENFSKGREDRAFTLLGSHLGTFDGVPGVYFAVWAPEANRVSVIGDWNGWDHEKTHLTRVGGTGVWQGFIAGVEQGARYKYQISSGLRYHIIDKADPYAFLQETPPATGSIVWSPTRAWEDAAWIAKRAEKQALGAPMSIYECHLGSWKRVPEEGYRSLSYREIAPLLSAHLKKYGFTHVELLPVMEHPFFGSWGYQVTGYFASSHRFGTPDDFLFLVDHLHAEGIGVILDWVPAHFPTDGHALAYFDGSHLYEHADRRQGFHPDWNSFIFNYGRNEVRSFLLSSARFWLEVAHADALRVDGVASMLNLDYSRRDGEWIPNKYGGKENLEAISLLKALNEGLFKDLPGIQTMAEESTAFPLVSKPVYVGGLGFGFKWDMGWMNDTLAYFARDPLFRSWHHNQITFRSMYAYSENFVLPLSHDEVVYGKGSLIRKMAGDPWQKFANLRAVYAYMWSQPGKKLLFMGGEFAQDSEWNHDGQLEWRLESETANAQIARLVTELNRVYRGEAALHERDADAGGFEWVDGSNAKDGVLTYLRKGDNPDDVILVACHFQPTPLTNYRVGVPLGGTWREVMNSDAKEFGGSGHGNLGGVESTPIPWNGRKHSLNLTLPPLGVIFLKPDARPGRSLPGPIPGTPDVGA